MPPPASAAPSAALPQAEPARASARSAGNSSRVAARRRAAQRSTTGRRATSALTTGPPMARTEQREAWRLSRQILRCALRRLCCASLPARAADTVTTSTHERLCPAVVHADADSARHSERRWRRADDRLRPQDHARSRRAGAKRWPRYVTSGRADADGKTFRFALAQPVRVHSSAIRRPDRRGPRAREFHRHAARPAGAATGETGRKPSIRRSSPAIKLRTGAYHNFTRLVFDWPKDVPYSRLSGRGQDDDPVRGAGASRFLRAGDTGAALGEERHLARRRARPPWSSSRPTPIPAITISRTARMSCSTCWRPRPTPTPMHRPAPQSRQTDADRSSTAKEATPRRRCARRRSSPPAAANAEAIPPTSQPTPQVKPTPPPPRKPIPAGRHRNRQRPRPPRPPRRRKRHRPQPQRPRHAVPTASSPATARC